MTYPALGDALASGKTRILSHAYSAIANSFIITAWFTSTDWASKHPDALKAFLRVTSDGAAYTNAHPAETAPLVSDLSKIPLDVIQKMPRSHTDLTIRLSDIQPLIDGSVKYKLISRGFPARELVYSELSVR